MFLYNGGRECECIFSAKKESIYALKQSEDSIESALVHFSIYKVCLYNRLRKV
jgi:hypothetical protein